MSNIIKIINYKNFKSLIKKYFLLALLENFIIVVAVPFFFNLILDDKLKTNDINQIIVFGIGFIILNIFRAYIAYVLTNEHQQAGIEVNCTLKKDCFNTLYKNTLKYFDTTKTSDIQRLIISDSEKSGEFFHIFIKLYVMGLIRAFILIVFMLILDYKIGIITIFIYFIGYTIIILGGHKTTKYLEKMRNNKSDIINYTNEATNGFETIKFLGIKKYRKIKLTNLLEAFKRNTLSLKKIIRIYTFVYELITFFITISIVYIGGLDLYTGICTYAGITLITQYSVYASNYIRWFVDEIPNFNDYKLSFNKVLKYIDNTNSEDLESGESLDKIESIEFKNVSFSYTNSKVITDFSLNANQNTSIALVGKTGSGKTTIINLLCRFYDTTEGEILINGKNIKNYKIKDLRKHIGYVMQENTIFETTILENINYNNTSISDEKIIEICKKIGLHECISKLPNGYNTILTNNGNILSSGEKQLLNFARIMVNNPDVILLDEVTASLSYNTEIKIQKAIQQITKGKICFIIAHRLSTIKNCDKIILLDKGKIKEEGNHQKLMNLKQEYYNLNNN